MRGQRRLYSMVTLVAAGFVLVTLPLLIAVVGSSIYVDRLALRSEQLVREGTLLARQGQTLSTQLLQMERNARQYRILGRDALVTLYQKRHKQLERTLDSLAATHLDIGADDARASLRAIAESIAEVVAQARPDSASLATAIGRFERLRRLSARIAEAADVAVRRELARLEQQSAQIRGFLFWQTVALVPVTLALIVLFAWLILRPIGRLGRAIRALGEGKPAAPIEVGGPPEIRDLGRELERLRVRLERLEAEKNRFLRHISHELKTPLAAIREGTELMADGSVQLDTPAHTEVVNILRSSSVELQELIENLLLTSAGNRSNVPAAIDPVALVDHVLARHRLAIARAEIVVERRIDERPFNGYLPLVQSALSNMIGNALRYSPNGGTLHLRIRRRGSRSTIEVADEGPGVAAEERAHIFEPFFQGSAAPRGHVRGTGVGLSVVRDCARAHEGEVELVDGEFPGAHLRLTLNAPKRARAGESE